MTEILFFSAQSSTGDRSFKGSTVSKLSTTLRLAASCAALGILASSRASAQASEAPGFLRPASQAMFSAPLFAAPTSPGLPAAVGPALSSTSLPEAPEPQLATDPQPKRGTDPSQRIARKSTKIIPSDWHAQRISAADKVQVGLEGMISVESLAATVLVAGYEHVVDGQPNYGTDRGAFAARFGAAALRGTTQTALTDMVFAPILHEDPRYYVKGAQVDPVKRAVYAATRTLITRKDNGSATINGSLLLGYAAAAALTPTYYPQSNRNFHDVVSVYGGSLGGAALSFGIAEFSEDVLRSLHLSRVP